MRTALRLAALAAPALAVLMTPVPGGAAELSVIDSLYALAESAYSSGDFSSAALHYTEVGDRILGLGADDGSAYLSSMSRRARFLAGRSLEGAGDCESALERYQLSLDDLPEIRDAVTMRMAACYSELGDFAASDRLLREVIDAEERTTLYLDAVEQLADTWRSAGEFDAAIQWYRLLLQEASSYDLRARVHYKMGRALAGRGDRDEALESFAVAVDEFPRSRYAYDALTEARRTSRAFTDRYHQGLVFYNRRRYREAAEFFVYYLRHNGNGEFRSNASYFLGRSHQRRNSFGTAAGKYEDVIEYGPTGEYYELAWLKLAYCRRAMGRVDRSIATYDGYVATHPDGDGVPDALWEKARLLEEKGRWQEAVQAFLELAERCPDGARAPDALFRAGLCLFKLERYEEADAAFADLFVDSGRDEAARALYWAGKSREALRQQDEAQARYVEASEMASDSFYGRRAAERVAGEHGSPSPGRRSGRNSIGRALAHSEGEEFRRFEAWLAEWYDLIYIAGERVALERLLRSDASFQRVDAFLALHMPDAAARELEILEDTFASDPRMLDLLIDYFVTVGLHKRAVRAAERILGMSPARSIGEAPTYLRRRICPKHFTDIVVPACRDNDIDQNLFYSLMRQESLFEPDAVSWVGARGLSQIMPHTGRWIARKLGHRGFKTRELLDPGTNVRFGTYYLRVQLEDHDGDVMRALAAYNGGPDNVERWWEYGGSGDTDVFVEDIGFAQTDDYVRRVYLYAEFYEEIYGGP